MSKDKNTTVTGGIGFCGLLTIVFIVLKLLNIITWPWLWVLSPLWIPIAGGITIILIVLLIAYLINLKH